MIDTKSEKPPKRARPLAVIEIGTNTSKLLIADVSASTGAVSPRTFRKETTRIGEGLSSTGEIAAAAVFRTVNAVGRFLRLVRQYNCEHVAGFSTHALRVAANGAEVAQRLEDETGLRFTIISGEEEGRFAWISARANLGPRAPHTYIIDLGGGSTEFVHASRRGIVESVSLPLGALELTEKYLHSDPVAPGEISRLRRYVRGEVTAVLAGGNRSGMRPSQVDLVASGGSVTTVRNMSDLSWDVGSLTSPKIRIGSVRRLEKKCLELPLEKRKRLPGLDPDRADIIPAGLAVLLAFLEAAGKRVLTVNPDGVRLGVLLHLSRNNFLW
jgi:exopolyphosphatase/guanosine-5'-triphosphate,3'-diphosphate pyrophosphatase